MTRSLPIQALCLAALCLAPAAHAESHKTTDSDASMTGASAVALGPLSITGAFARATLPGAPVGGGFMVIANTSDSDDILLSASCPLAGRTEIHEMAMEGDVMRMRPLPDGLPIPAGQTVELAPGGYHLMLMQLAGPLVAGEVAPVTLTFRDAGTVTVPLAIADLGSRSAPTMEGMD